MEGESVGCLVGKNVAGCMDEGEFVPGEHEDGLLLGQTVGSIVPGWKLAGSRVAGEQVGVLEGLQLGVIVVGTEVGLPLGDLVCGEEVVGAGEGISVGVDVGAVEGLADGLNVGSSVGDVEGVSVGEAEGPGVGEDDDGWDVGSLVGVFDGMGVWVWGLWE